MKPVVSILVVLLVAGCSRPIVSRPSWMQAQHTSPFEPSSVPERRCSPDGPLGRELRTQGSGLRAPDPRAAAICGVGSESPSRTGEQVRIDTAVVESRMATTHRR